MKIKPSINCLFCIVLFCLCLLLPQSVNALVEGYWKTKEVLESKEFKCEEITKFKWKESYGSESDPYLKTPGEELELKPSVVDDDGKWYTVFAVEDYGGIPTEFVELKQEKVGWTQGTESGEDYKGYADLKVKTTKDGKSLDLGIYKIKIKATQDLTGIVTDCVKTESKTVFLKVNFDCSKALTAADKCDDPKNKETCEKKCPSQYCDYTEGKCTEKSSGSAGAGTTASESSASDKYGTGYFEKLNPPPQDYKGALPPCAFSGTCRDVNNLIELIINFGRGMFAIMGSFAFAFFVYGGFTIILSLGNSEKVNKGKQILTAAIIGIVVAFTAYMLIDFMLDALKVNETFRGIK